MTIEPSTIRNTPTSPPIPSPYPFGLRVIIALFIAKTIGTIAVIILGVMVMFNASLPLELQAEATALVHSPESLVIYAFLAPLNLVAAIGLWRRKRWAWVLTMVLLAYSMALDIESFWRGQPLYVSMFLNVIQVGYLNQREVQDLFGEPNKRKAHE